MVCSAGLYCFIRSSTNSPLPPDGTAGDGCFATGGVDPFDLISWAFSSAARVFKFIGVVAVGAAVAGGVLTCAGEN